ncbi:MAG: HAD hydrolase-like protein, partial [Eubacteriales bacterium]
MSPFNTVLFDLDGTLIDSSAGITRSVAYALKKRGYGEVR